MVNDNKDNQKRSQGQINEIKYLILDDFLKDKTQEFVGIFEQIDEIIESMWADFKYAQLSYTELQELIGLPDENNNHSEHFDLIMKFYIKCYDIKLINSTGISGNNECGDDFTISKEYGLAFEFHPKHN